MLHNSLLVINRLYLTEPAVFLFLFFFFFFFNFFWVFLASKGSNCSESEIFIIQVNMLAILPWEWERVYTPIVIFLDDLTFENALLFSTRHYQQLAADTCMLSQHKSVSPITSPSFFSRSS